jgi:hypothetical protein
MNDPQSDVGSVISNGCDWKMDDGLVELVKHIIYNSETNIV